MRVARRIAAELRVDLEDPAFRAELNFRGLVYGPHPLSRDPRGGVRDITRLTRQQAIEISTTTTHILFRSEAVGHAKLTCRSRHQLHQPTRSCPARRTSITTALHLHHTRQQVLIDIVLRSCLRKQLMQIGSRKTRVHSC